MSSNKKRKDSTIPDGSSKILKNVSGKKHIIEECSICEEEFNKSTRKKFTCSCGQKICISCIRQCIFSKTFTEASCSSCNRIFNRQQLNTIFGSSLPKYNKHLKEILFNIQKVRFPMYYDRINDMKIEIAYKKEYNKIKELFRLEVRSYFNQISQLKKNNPKSPKINELKKKIDEISGYFEKEKINRKYYDIKNKITNINENYSDDKSAINSEIEKLKKQIVDKENKLDKLKKLVNDEIQSINNNYDNYLAKINKYLKMTPTECQEVHEEPEFQGLLEILAQYFNKITLTVFQELYKVAVVQSRLKSLLRIRYTRNLENKRDKIREINYDIINFTKKIKDLKFILKCNTKTKKQIENEFNKVKKLKEKLKVKFDNILDNKIKSKICPIKFPKPLSMKIVKKKKPKKYIKHCSIEGCQGMLDETWKCALCKQKVCSKCFENIGDKYHKCKKENVLSAKLIKSQTKPCPKCGAPVERASGCSQMMCMNPIGTNKTCNTVFDFKTGKIDNGIIHNPHFYQWREKSGNNDTQFNVFQCGRRFPSFNDIQRRICKYFGLNTKEKWQNFMKIKKKYLMIIRNIYISCVTFTNRLNNYLQIYYPVNKSRSIDTTNINFLTRKLSKSSYQMQLYKYHNCIKMNIDIHHIYDLFNKIVRENIIKFFVKPSVQNLNIMYKTIIELTNYSNKQLMKYSIIYNKTVGIISKGFEIQHKKFTKKEMEKEILKYNSPNSSSTSK